MATETGQSTKILELDITVYGEETKPTRPGKKPKPVWTVKGNGVGRVQHILRDELDGRKWQGYFSFWEDPTDDLLEYSREDAMSALELLEYKQGRSGLRAMRLQERARRWQEESNRRHEISHKATEGIPFGQPILVGHHSERHHRAAIKKSWDNLGKAVEASNVANDLEWKAARAELRADGDNITPGYVQNRINETEAELRDLGRRINGFEGTGNTEPQTPATGQYRETLLVRQFWAQRDLADWQKLAQEVGIMGTEEAPQGYSKANVKKGDLILTRGSWYKVVRANAKTITLHYFQEGQSWSNPCNYAEIDDHIPEADINWDEFVKRSNMNSYIRRVATPAESAPAAS